MSIRNHKATIRAQDLEIKDQLWGYGGAEVKAIKREGRIDRNDGYVFEAFVISLGYDDEIELKGYEEIAIAVKLRV